MRSGEATRFAAGRQQGMVYVFLLVAVALIGLVSANAVQTGAMVGRRDAERQLLAIGMEYRRALVSYAGAGSGRPAGMPLAGPRTLEELLADPRAPGVRRHLRKIYPDPLSGKDEWGLVRDPHGFIIGIYSLAEGVPIQQAGFEAALLTFENAGSYAQWVFGLQAPVPQN